jgi:ribonuclease HI
MPARPRSHANLISQITCGLFCLEEEKLTFDPHALKIYVDGSCLENPGGTGGFAARVEYPLDQLREDEDIEYRGYFETNNNRMELRACIFAHEWTLERINELRVQRIQVVTDSKYVYDGYSWAIGWSQRKYCSSDGRPIKNVDLWKDLMRLRRKLGRYVRMEAVLIKGKSDEPTKRVDEKAKAAGKIPTHIDWGFNTGKIGRSKNNTGKAAKLFPAAGQELIIRIYHSAIARRNIQIFKFQVFDEARGDFFEKFEAYAIPSVGNELHRGHIYRVRMNRLLRYPNIVEILEEVEESDLVTEISASTT